jgi:hypothetical protein
MHAECQQQQAAKEANKKRKAAEKQAKEANKKRKAAEKQAKEVEKKRKAGGAGGGAAGGGRAGWACTACTFVNSTPYHPECGLGSDLCVFTDRGSPTESL